MISINPEAATRDDVALLAAEHQDMENVLRYIERMGKDGSCSKAIMAVAASECVKRLEYHRQYKGRPTQG